MQNIFNKLITTNGDMSGDVVSETVDLSKIDGYAIYASWTGSPVGSIKIRTAVNDSNFVDYPGSSTSVNGAGEALWEITTAFYDRVQVVYTRTSGSGTLNIQINGKGTES